jgi:hypothetical protein
MTGELVRDAEPSKQLVGQWAVCGIAAAASRFIPVPLLDDAVKLRATQVAVLRTLRANGRTYPSDAVEALYAGTEAGAAGQVREVLRYLRSIPRRVLFFPVRKYVALFGAVKGVPSDVMHVVLLGRTVHRSLVQGRLAAPASSGGELGKADTQALRQEAVRIRAAYDDALHGMDLRLLTGALADGLSQGKGLTSAAVGFARKTFGRDDDAESGLNPGGEVGAGAERVEEVFRRPEITRLLLEFDETFESSLADPG